MTTLPIQEFVLACKKELICRDLKSQENAVLKIKQYLEKCNEESVIKIFIDLDTHIFLLNGLAVATNDTLTTSILKCLEYFCSHKLYYVYNFAVFTAETILKSILFQIKDHGQDDYVAQALKLISKIIANLDNFHSKTTLRVDRFLNTTRELLLHKNNIEVVSATTAMFSSLLLYKHLKKCLNDNYLDTIGTIWQMCVQKLFQFFPAKKEDAFSSICALCNSILRFGDILKKKLVDPLAKFRNQIREIIVTTLQNLCIPYVAELVGNSNKLEPEYLCFLKNLLESDLPKKKRELICKQLIEEKNFNVIAQFINSCEVITDLTQREFYRNVCLSVLSNIMCSSSENIPFITKKGGCEKYFCKTLQILRGDVNCWLSLLNNPEVAFDSKLGIIKICCIYYVQSKNLEETRSECLESIIIFLTNIRSVVNIQKHYLKDLWLLTAVLYTSFPHIKDQNHIMLKANLVLQRLILADINSLKDINTYNPAIIFWICEAPGVKKGLQTAVLSLWLTKWEENINCQKALLAVMKNCPSVNEVLVNLVKNGTPKISNTATYILRKGFEQGCLLNSEEILKKLYISVPESILRIANTTLIKEKVINSVSMLHFALNVPLPVDIDLIKYSICTFTNCISNLGFSPLLPRIFYIKAFDFVRKILHMAKNYAIHDVFVTLIKSEHILYTFTGGLLSNNLEISYKAGKIIYHLLEYQNMHHTEGQNNLVLPKNCVFKMFATSNYNQMLLNMRIVNAILNNSLSTVLKLPSPIDDALLSGLFSLNYNFISKPNFYSVTKQCFNSLQTLLKYSYTNKPKLHERFCSHAGIHTIIMMYSDKETSRPLDHPFLHFVLCWLKFSAKHKTKLSNPLSINFIQWKMSLIEIIDMLVSSVHKIENEHKDLVGKILNQVLVFEEFIEESTIIFLKEFLRYNFII